MTTTHINALKTMINKLKPLSFKPIKTAATVAKTPKSNTAKFKKKADLTWTMMSHVGEGNIPLMVTYETGLGDKAVIEKFLKERGIEASVELQLIRTTKSLKTECHLTVKLESDADEAAFLVNQIPLDIFWW